MLKCVVKMEALVENVGHEQTLIIFGDCTMRYIKLAS